MLKDFVISLVRKLNVSQAHTHVSAILFSTKSTVVFDFKSLQTTAEVIRKLDQMKLQAQNTYIDRALKLADSDVFTFSSGMRANVAKVSYITETSVMRERERERGRGRGRGREPVKS